MQAQDNKGHQSIIRGWHALLFLEEHWRKWRSTESLKLPSDCEPKARSTFSAYSIYSYLERADFEFPVIPYRVWRLSVIMEQMCMRRITRVNSQYDSHAIMILCSVMLTYVVDIDKCMNKKWMWWNTIVQAIFETSRVTLTLSSCYWLKEPTTKRRIKVNSADQMSFRSRKICKITTE